MPLVATLSFTINCAEMFILFLLPGTRLFYLAPALEESALEKPRGVSKVPTPSFQKS